VFVAGGEERFLHYADRHLRGSEGEKKKRRSSPVEMTERFNEGRFEN
jgi:hypothetical protein